MHTTLAGDQSSISEFKRHCWGGEEKDEEEEEGEEGKKGKKEKENEKKKKAAMTTLLDISIIIATIPSGTIDMNSKPTVIPFPLLNINTTTIILYNSLSWH